MSRPTKGPIPEALREARLDFNRSLREAYRIYREKKIAAGYCGTGSCLSKAVPGQTNCTEHARLYREWQRAKGEA
jgi:hypothetical protein